MTYAKNVLVLLLFLALAQTTAAAEEHAHSMAMEQPTFGIITAILAALTIASTSTTQTLQFVLIAFGGFGTLYVAYRIARAKEESFTKAVRILAPHAILLVIIIAVNFYLFMTPMAHRGG